MDIDFIEPLTTLSESTEIVGVSLKLGYIVN